MKTSVLTGIFVAAFTIMTSAQQVKPHCKIANRIKLDSNGTWDYLTVDEETNRLYISHNSIVQVVDLNTSKQIGIIPNIKGAHGIALAKEFNKGFITGGKDSSVTVFDLKTNETLAKIFVTGQKPDAILYDKATKRVFSFNGKSGNTTVIDAKTNTVKGTIPLDGKPEFGVADGKGKIFVNLEDKSEVEEIDASNMKSVKHWSIAPGEGPTGLAIDIKKRRLFSTCDNKMMVVSDADKGKVITTVPIQFEPDAAGFDPEKMIVYCSNSGTLTVIKDSADTYKVQENFETQRGAKTMALNTKTHHIYLPTADFFPLTPVHAGKERPKPKPKPGTFVVLDVVEVE